MKEIRNLISLIAISGNILFILWVLYNGINEDFAGTMFERISYIGLMGLLATNAILLIGNRKNQKL